MPFGQEEAGEFLDVLLGVAVGADPRVGPSESGAHRGAPLHDLKQLILAKTEGTPFFMEEIVQELREQGVLPGVGATSASPLPTDLHIPTTVQGVLAARIDRLVPEEKALLQQLAVIGREFSLSLVRQVIVQPEEELYRLLSALQRKEFLYEQPAFSEVEYIFKHALTQEVAYSTVLQERRKALHERTGQAIERLYQERLEEHYDELAHHYQRSGNTEKAIAYLHKAGQQAVQRSANEEAINQLTTALELLTTFPDSHERAQQELMLRLTLCVPLQIRRGFSSPEVQATYTRAQELCQQVGDTHQLFTVLMGLRMFHQVRGAFPMAREVGTQLLALAQKTQDPILLIDANRSLGSIFCGLGEFDLARTHLEQSLALCEAQRHQP